MRKYAKGGCVRVQKDRARGGAVLQPTASKFVKPEVLYPQASRFEATPDTFRTGIQRQSYGPKRTAGGELSQTEGESKLRTAREKSGRPVMKEAAKITAAEEKGETAAEEAQEGEEC